MTKAVLHLILSFIGLLSLFSLYFIYPKPDMPEKYQSKPTIAKVMMIYGDKPIYQRALDTHREHSRRFGYPHIVLRTSILDSVWSKPAILLSLLLQELQKPPSERLEWLFWFDADTVLMNPNVPLETFLPPPHISNVHIILTKDWNGMNNGVFPIRVHPWSVELLSATIAYPAMNPDVELALRDQSAMDNVLNQNDHFANSVVYYPLRWFNAYMRQPNGEELNPDSPAYLQVHHGDLLVHFPGTPGDKLNETMEPYLAIAEAHRKEWELPLERTGYINKTKLFWEDMKLRG